MATKEGLERRKANLIRWKPGQSGNPKGRKPGKKHVFGEAFWSDLATEWHRRGIRALQALSDEEFVKIAAQKAPQLIEADVDVRINGWLDVLRARDGGG